MRRMWKWSIPMLAVVGLAIGFSSLAARAQETKPEAAKGKVEGIVTDSSGKAVEGAQVRLIVPGQRGGGKQANMQAEGQRPPRGGQMRNAVAETTTNDKGEFTLEAPAGNYILAAMHRGTGMARQEVTVKANETTKADLKLEHGAGGKGGKGGKGGNAGQ